jgi:hypothetical protein
MATGALLTEMVRALRAETGKSLNVALGAGERDALVYTLQRTQEQLYEDYDWPFLLGDRDVDLVPGTRLYGYPEDIFFDYVADVWAATGSTWTRLEYGLSPADYSIYDSEAGVTGWPPTKWRHLAGTILFEVWPVPAQAGRLRVRGQLRLKPLVDDNDVSTLDGQLIVLFAAAEILARQKAEDAQYKLGMARERLRRIQARQGSNKLRDPIIVGGGPLGLSSRPARVGLDYIPMGFRNGG